MKRRIVEIDEAKCNGCGACANACHEGAIAMVNGKAHLMRDDYCDGFGDCLPALPHRGHHFCGARGRCPTTRPPCRLPSSIKRPTPAPAVRPAPSAAAPAVWPRPCTPMPKPPPLRRKRPPASCASGRCRSNWCPTNAPYFDGAKLLIAADCTAYAYAAFHQKFIRGHITLVGCPKLDDVDYSRKADPASSATTTSKP